MLSLPTAFIAFILGFGFLVFIHELGHFLVAKWVGIRCTQFALGFGPAICSWRKGVGLRLGSTEPEYERLAAEAMGARGADPEKATPEQVLAVADKLGLGETEYRLNYLPLGGYVKMLGQEDMDPAAQSRDPRAFNAKSVGARFAVISAGVIMNLITGVIFFIIAFMAGVEFPPAIVGGVVSDMPAANAYAVGHEDDPAYRGLRVGDRVTHIDGDEVMDFTDIKLASALGAAGTPLELTIERRGLPQPLTYLITPQVDSLDSLLSMGILPPRSTRVALVEKDGPLAQAGLEADMEVAAVGGEPVESYADFFEAVTASEGGTVQTTFRHSKTGQTITVPLEAQPPVQLSPTGEVHLAGFVPATRITAVDEGSPAERGGLQTGDLIAELAGTAWPAPGEVRELIPEADDRGVEVVVWRGGETVPLGRIQPERGILGIGLTHYLDEPVVAQMLPGTAAAALEDLTGGSRILSVDGRPIDSWTQLYRAFAAAEVGDDGSATVEVRYLRNIADGVETTRELVLPPATVRELAHTPWLPPSGLLFDIRHEPVKAGNPWDATVLGVIKTKQFIQQAYVMLLRLVQRTVHIEHLRGPAGIVYEGTQISRRGWSYLFYFLGLLSVNLAVINFLPIPIADGGHAVFLLAEKIKGSPVSPKVQVAAMYVGLLLIGGLFLLVTYNDIARMIPLFGG